MTVGNHCSDMLDLVSKYPAAVFQAIRRTLNRGIDSVQRSGHSQGLRARARDAESSLAACQRERAVFCRSSERKRVAAGVSVRDGHVVKGIELPYGKTLDAGAFRHI